MPKIPIGLASVVLAIAFVLQCALTVFQVLENQFAWAAIGVSVTAGILGVLRVWQVVTFPKTDGEN